MVSIFVVEVLITAMRIMGIMLIVLKLAIFNNNSTTSKK